MSGRLLRAPAPPPPGLVDLHVHVTPDTDPDPPYGRLSGAEALALMAAAGVARAAVFPPTRPKGYRDANEALHRWAKGCDGRVLAFARLGPGEGVADVAGYRGFKLLPHVDGLPSTAVLEAVSATGLPVVVHGGEHTTARTLRRLLAVLEGPLVLAHLGAFPCSLERLHEALDLAGRDPRVFLDTSGVWLAGFFQEAVTRVPQKLVFGSDAPLVHPLVAWGHLAAAVHDDGLLARIGRDLPGALLEGGLP